MFYNQPQYYLSSLSSLIPSGLQLTAVLLVKWSNNSSSSTQAYLVHEGSPLSISFPGVGEKTTMQTESKFTDIPLQPLQSVLTYTKVSVQAVRKNDHNCKLHFPLQANIASGGCRGDLATSQVFRIWSFFLCTHRTLKITRQPPNSPCNREPNSQIRTKRRTSEGETRSGEMRQGEERRGWVGRPGLGWAGLG